MSVYSDVFAREEKKYVLSAEQYRAIRKTIESHLVPDEFGFSQVRSLYFDTPEFSLIEHSLDKPRYKEKLRVRVYGEPSDTTQAFVEIKKKYEGIVYKRRVSMTLAGAQAYLAGMAYEEACCRFPLLDELADEQSLSQRSIQIAREIDFFREHYARLAASMLVVCERSAFGDPDGGELRITFDECIGAHPFAENLSEVDRCVPLTADGEVIMEVKNAGPLPFWLVDCLSDMHAYPQTFSKYGTAYLTLIAPEEVVSSLAASAKEDSMMPAAATVLNSELSPAGAFAGVRLPLILAQQRTAGACNAVSTNPRGRHARVTERSKTCA